MLLFNEYISLSMVKGEIMVPNLHHTPISTSFPIVLLGKGEILCFRILIEISAADRGRRVVFVTFCEKLVSKIPDRVYSRVFYSGLGANPKSTQGQMGFPMAGRSI